MTTSIAKTDLPQRIARWLVVLAVVLIAAYLIDFWRAAAAKDLVPWGGDLKAAVAAAGEQNKPVLLLATAKWCGPCQDMKSEVFGNDDDAAWISEVFVPVVFRHETMTESQMDLAQRLGGIRGWPTLWVFDAEGRLIAHQDGYAGRTALMDWLSTVAAQDRVVSTATDVAP